MDVDVPEFEIKLNTKQAIYGMFNQHVFNTAKQYTAELEDYFKYHRATKDNKLMMSLVQLVKEKDFGDINGPLITATISTSDKTNNEVTEIFNQIVDAKGKDASEAKVFLDTLNQLVASVILQRAQFKANNPSDFLYEIQRSASKTVSMSPLRAESFRSFDIGSISTELESGGIASSFKWINDTFKPTCQYGKREIVMVSFPPGCGKSLFAANEALFMALNGHKVHMLIMGDLFQSDLFIRLAAIYTGLPFSEVRKNALEIFEEMGKVLEDNLSVTIRSSSKVTVDEYVEFVKNSNFDVVFVDYDSNFKTDAVGDSMYLAYGDVYDRLTEISEAGKLVFVLAQPKVSSWGQEAIPLHQIGESSRKQHIVSMAITRGKVDTCPLPIGITSIVKSRRGEVGVKDYNIRLNNGRFKSIPKSLYEHLKSFTEYKDFDEAEIDALITQFGSAEKSVQNRVNQAVNSTPVPSNPALQRVNVNSKPTGDVPF